jgi:hypothetical protein
MKRIGRTQTTASLVLESAALAGVEGGFFDKTSYTKDVSSTAVAEETDSDNTDARNSGNMRAFRGQFIGADSETINNVVTAGLNQQRENADRANPTGKPSWAMGGDK